MVNKVDTNAVPNEQVEKVHKFVNMVHKQHKEIPKLYKAYADISQETIIIFFYIGNTLY